MNHAKILKFVSVIALIIGIISLIVGIILVASGGLMIAATSNPDVVSSLANDSALTGEVEAFNAATGTDLDAGGVATAVSGIVLLAAVFVVISAIFTILEGVFGLRAAKGKGATAAVIIGIIALTTAVVRLITAAISGGGASGVIGAIPAIIIAGIYLYCAKAIRDGKAKM